MNHAAILEEDTMEKPKSADGVSGMLLKTMDGKFIFRVYNFYDFNKFKDNYIVKFDNYCINFKRRTI